jgi:hypothetical protein
VIDREVKAEFKQLFLDSAKALERTERGVEIGEERLAIQLGLESGYVSG